MMLRETPDQLASDMPKYRVVNYGDKRFTVRAIKRSARRRARLPRRLDAGAVHRSADDERDATPIRSKTCGGRRSWR